MTQKKQLPTRTTMYSVETFTTKDKKTEQKVVTHHFPWPRDSEKLTQFIDRGFTFQMPQMAIVVPETPLAQAAAIPAAIPAAILCPICQKPCKSEIGLKVHQKSHREK